MQITLHAPQIVYLSLVLIGIVTAIIDHGKPRTNENAWSTLVSAAIAIALLYWGGFFK